MERDRMTSGRRQGKAEVNSASISLVELSDQRNLFESLKQLRRKGGHSAGVDGVRIEHILRNKQGTAWIGDIARRLRSGQYNPSPVVERRIPKPGRPGKFRRIGIPTIADRVVARTLSSLLQPSLEQGFEETSFGYRLDRGASDCVSILKLAIEEALQTSRENWIIKTDIACLFDTINHGKLLDTLRHSVPNNKIRRLIRKFMRASRIVGGRPKATRIGIPQGLPLSPLLANVYLDTLDKWYENRRT